MKRRLSHVLEGVERIRAALLAEKRSVPLIGFSAAPWTLMFYMVGGSSGRNTEAGEKWLAAHPSDSRALLRLLTRVVIDYLSAQADAGCHALQLFEAMGDHISPPSFAAFAQPCIVEIAAELKKRHPGVPLLGFTRGAMFALPQLQAAGFDVVTLDLTPDRKGVVKQLEAEAAGRGGVRRATLQGNIDPSVLLPGKPVEGIDAAVASLLADVGPQRLIANLGAGLGGGEAPERVSRLVDQVHTQSRALVAAEAGR